MSSSKTTICTNFITELNDAIGKQAAESIYVLVDSNTEKLCLPTVLQCEKLKGCHVISILSGDENKNVESAVKIWNYLVDNKRITAKECEQVMPDVPRQTINYDLRKMQEMKLLHSVGESINTYYEANF